LRTIIVFVSFIYFTIEFDGTPLRYGTWLHKLLFSMTRRSLYWRVHLEQWTQ